MARQFMEFDQQAKQDYTSFRDACNKTFADFIMLSWEVFQGKKPIPQPKFDEIPPVVYDDKEQRRPHDDTPVVIEEVIPNPKPEPQPSPIEPIVPKTEPRPTPLFSFPFFGLTLQLPLSDQCRFSLNDLTNTSIAKAWKQLASPQYDNLVASCLELRTHYQLCDWSYLQMIHSLCNTFLEANSNEAELLQAYIFSQSGYQMRLAIGNNQLIMLYASHHTIFNERYYLIDNIYYYALQPLPSSISVCPGKFPNEKSLSLAIHQEQLISGQQLHYRTLTFDNMPSLSATVATDQNLMDFCQSYPTSYMNGNFMTRWALYANMPLSQPARDRLYPQLRKIIAGHNDFDAVNLLCHWVQTAFVYQYDDTVWGGDRAFFADETLHYPYCDCEDRSILLTRIVRDLLGLQCALIYYPGHLATAIALGEEAKGDYLRHNGIKYLICDPTYINAPIGESMPKMNNNAAKIIVL